MSFAESVAYAMHRFVSSWSSCLICFGCGYAALGALWFICIGSYGNRGMIHLIAPTEVFRGRPHGRKIRSNPDTLRSASAAVNRPREWTRIPFGS